MSDPVSPADELLDIGARVMRPHVELEADAVAAVEALAEAWFGPGWREGISREWVVGYSDAPVPGEHPSTDRERVEHVARKATDWLPKDDVSVLVRLVGPWQRVEGEQ